MKRFRNPWIAYPTRPREEVAEETERLRIARTLKKRIDQHE